MAHFEKFQAAALGNMCAHYDRSPELDHGYRRDNIDGTRTHLNYNLGPDHGGVSQVDFINGRISSLNLKRAPRKDAVRMADCIVTMPKGYCGDQREFFEAVCHTLDGMFGSENCVSAYVHMDEAQPHVHYAFVPVTDDGRLSAKDLLNRNFLKSFHSKLEEGVSHELGIDRAGLALTDEEREERGGRYVGLNEFKEAKAQVERENKRLEYLQRACADVEPLALGIGESAAALVSHIGDGGREQQAAAENQQLRERVSHLEAEKRELEQRGRELERERAGVAGRVRELGARFDQLRERVTHLLRGLEYVPDTVSRWTAELCHTMRVPVLGAFEIVARAATEAAQIQRGIHERSRSRYNGLER